MEWIIVIAVFLLIARLIKTQSIKEKNHRIEWLENHIREGKQRVIKYHQDTIVKYTGTRMLGLTKKQTKDKIIEWETEIEKINLWNKHVMTIQANATYALEGKWDLMCAWDDYLSKYSSIVQGIEVGVGNPFEEMDYLIECMDTFLAKLENFGYDGEKEQQEIRERLLRQHNK